MTDQPNRTSEFIEYEIPANYQHPAPDQLDVNDHDQLVALAKFYGLAPGNTILLDGTGGLQEIVGCSPEQAATLWLDYKAQVTDLGYDWVSISCLAFDADMVGFAIATSAMVNS